ANAELYGIVTLRELGLRLRPVDERLPYRVRPERGVFVEAVTPGSIADRAGLERGDVIIAVAGSPATTPAELDRAVEAEDLRLRVPLEVVRGNQQGTLDLTSNPRRLTRMR
ncbi:MAG: PDZ domain-containing protein, partial [Planctomycetota bacterium]